MAIKNTAPEVCSIKPIQPNRAILAVREKLFIEHLCKGGKRQMFGSFSLRLVKWSSEVSIKDPMVTSYGRWIRVRNLPVDRWSMETFQIIGENCGGLVEIANKTLTRLDMLEASIKTKNNLHGFIPASLSIDIPNSQVVSITIEPFYRIENFYGFLTDVHGVKIPKVKFHTRVTQSSTNTHALSLAIEVNDAISSAQAPIPPFDPQQPPPHPLSQKTQKRRLLSPSSQTLPNLSNQPFCPLTSLI